MASRLGFLAEGCREVGRRVHRFGLRRHLVATDRERPTLPAKAIRPSPAARTGVPGLAA